MMGAKLDITQSDNGISYTCLTTKVGEGDRSSIQNCQLYFRSTFG